jgi:hypothetical protein
VLLRGSIANPEDAFAFRPACRALFFRSTLSFLCVRKITHQLPVTIVLFTTSIVKSNSSTIAIRPSTGLLANHEQTVSFRARRMTAIASRQRAFSHYLSSCLFLNQQPLFADSHLIHRHRFLPKLSRPSSKTIPMESINTLAPTFCCQSPNDTSWIW